MWLHKFIPQPCFDNAGPAGDSGGGGGNTRGTMKDMPGRAEGSKSIGEASGYGGSGGSGGIMMSGGGYIETAQGIPGYGTPQQARATNYGGSTQSTSSSGRSGGGSSTVTRNVLPAPPPTTYAPPKPTISAPTLAQLTALTPKSYTAPVTAANAATYGPAAMMSNPVTASTAALASSIANAPTASRATSSPNMGPSVSQGPMSSPNTTAGSGYGSLASRAAMQSNIDAPSNLGVRSASDIGLNRPTTSNAGGKADREGPSFSGGPQSTPASNAGNAVLGQSRSNVMGGFQDPSTNAVGYSAAPGLLSRVGEANKAQNNSVLGQAVNAMGNLTGMAPVGLLANQAQIARNQFMAENALAPNPVAETTVNTGTLEPEPDKYTTVDIAGFGTPTTPEQRKAQEQNLAAAVQRANERATTTTQPQGFDATGMSMPGLTSPATRGNIAGALNTMRADQQAQQMARQNAANAASAASNAGASQLDQGFASGFDDPGMAMRANIAREAFGLPDTMTNQQIGQGLLNAQTRAAQQAQRRSDQQQYTNEIGGMLRNMQNRSQPDPASAPTNQEMPGSVRDNLQGFGLINRLRQNMRQASLGGAPTAPDVPSANQQFYQQIAPELPQEVQQDTGFINGVQQIETDLNLPTGSLLAVMNFETGGTFDPGQRNAAGSSGTGLIQFMDATARALGTTTEELASMTREQQLGYVRQYLEQFSDRLGPNPSIEDVYMAVLYPRAIGEPNDFTLFEEGTTAYRQNRGLDRNRDGTITKAEAARSVVRNFNRYNQLAGNVGGDAGDADIGGFLDAALSDEEAQAFLDQQGYSKTEAGKWTDGTQSFDSPMEAIKSLPLMSQLQLWLWSQNGSTPPPTRDMTNRGGNDRWIPPGLLTASMGGPVTQPGNDNANGGPFVNGAGNWTPPGLLNRPYSNPFAYRNPWLTA